MGLVLHRRDGTVAEWRRGGLRPVEERKRDRRREYVPGGVISMWNMAAYEEYEASAEGQRERREWEREMLAQVDEA